MYFNYSNSFFQYLSILGSLLLIAGNYFIGKKVSDKFFADFKSDNYLYNFHLIIIGNVVLNIFLEYLVFFGLGNIVVLRIIGALLIILGFSALLNFRKYFLVNFTNSFAMVKSSNFALKLIFLLLAGFFIVAIAPITNADALDYHIGVPLSILNKGSFVWQTTWFHQGLSGIGENSILLSLSLQTEQYSTLLQTISVFSIVSLFYFNDKKFDGLPKEYRSQLILIFLSVPVLLFLSSSPKPQLIGVALSSFLFVHIVINKINLTSKNLFILSSLLFYIIGIKLNFIFSSFILFLGLFYYNNATIQILSIKSNLKLVSIIFLAFVLVLGPVIYFKSSIAGTNIPSYLYPIPNYYPGRLAFLEYLKNYDDVKLSFPISLFFPSSPGVYSMILGLNLVIVIWLLFKNKVTTKKLLFVLLLCTISFIFGQRTSRFYIEPFVWSLLLINSFSYSYFNNIILKFGIYIVSVLQICILLFSSYSISSGVLTKQKRESVLSSKANGYTLANWVNLKLPESSKILIEHRSLSLFNQKVYSSDWINYVNKNKGEDQFYLDYLKKEEVKYVLIIGDSQKDSKLFSYCDSLVYGPFYGQIATRNPFNSGKNFKAWIFTSKF
jgi:hypothetical protein